VNLVYANGVTGARTLYDLRLAWEKFPQQIEDWVRSGASITTRSILAAITEFRAHEKPEPDLAPQPAGDTAQVAPDASQEFRAHETSDISGKPPLIWVDGNEECLQSAASNDTPTTSANDAIVLAVVTPPSEETPVSALHREKPPRQADKSRASLALPKVQPSAGEIMVQYKGRMARVAAATTVRIIVDGSDMPMEVPLADLVFTP
jgi:hypothetical protein